MTSCYNYLNCYVKLRVAKIVLEYGRIGKLFSCPEIKDKEIGQLSDELVIYWALKFYIDDLALLFTQQAGGITFLHSPEASIRMSGER